MMMIILLMMPDNNHRDLRPRNDGDEGDVDIHAAAAVAVVEVK